MVVAGHLQHRDQECVEPQAVLRRQPGRAIYRGKERRFAARADQIISITPDFIPFLKGLGVPDSKITVIENWAPVNEIVPLPCENAWKREQGLSGKRVVLYSGTLGLKHKLALLSNVAAHYQSLAARMHIVAVTPGARRQPPEGRGRPAPFAQSQGFCPGSPMKGCRSFVIGGHSDSHHRAGCRALFRAVENPGLVLRRPTRGSRDPADNLAAKTITRAGAGLVVEPGDERGFLAKLDRLLADPALARELGQCGRSYAEKTFDIQAMAGRFLALSR